MRLRENKITFNLANKCIYLVKLQYFELPTVFSKCTQIFLPTAATILHSQDNLMT